MHKFSNNKGRKKEPQKTGRCEAIKAHKKLDKHVCACGCASLNEFSSLCYIFKHHKNFFLPTGSENRI